MGEAKRLLEKKDTPSLNITTYLSALKQYIIAHTLYNYNLVSPFVAVLIAVISSLDNDADVCRNATFKLKGMRNYLHTNFNEVGTHIYIYGRTCMRAGIHVLVHTYIHTYSHIYIYAYNHT